MYKRQIEYSTRIYQIYLKYVAPEDIHVYSIDEVFIDLTHYLPFYRMTAHELVTTMLRAIDVYKRQLLRFTNLHLKGSRIPLTFVIAVLLFLILVLSAPTVVIILL